MYWEKEIRFKITTRRIFAGILVTMSVLNLVIVGTALGASSSSPPSSATPTLSLTPTLKLQPSITPTELSGTFTPTLVFTETFTLTPSATSTFTVTPTDTVTATPTSTATSCVPWSYWPIYWVQTGNTLTAIARFTSSTVRELMQANCLTSSLIYSGQKLYVPRLPVDTPTSTWTPTLTEIPTLIPSITSCPPWDGWTTVYIVQPNDTLLSIAQAIDSSPKSLMTANCLASDVVYPGQQLYVPRLPVNTVTPTSTPSLNARG